MRDENDERRRHSGGNVVHVGLGRRRRQCGGLAPLTYDWNFGDGSANEEGVDLTNPVHAYADNGSYTVTLSVTDALDETGMTTATGTVFNVPPSVNAGPNQTVPNGTPLVLSVSFSDPGSDDTHTASAIWGDGDAESLLVNESLHTATGSHVFPNSPVGTSFTVAVTVTDDDSGSGIDTLRVTMAEAPPVIVPEPAGAALMLLGLGGLARLRRRR